MENIYDQVEAPNEQVAQIVNDITSEEVLEVITQEDYTTADESDIVWETL